MVPQARYRSAASAALVIRDASSGYPHMTWNQRPDCSHRFSVLPPVLFSMVDLDSITELWAFAIGTVVVPH